LTTLIQVFGCRQAGLCPQWGPVTQKTSMPDFNGIGCCIRIAPDKRNTVGATHVLPLRVDTRLGGDANAIKKSLCLYQCLLHGHTAGQYCLVRGRGHVLGNATTVTLRTFLVTCSTRMDSSCSCANLTRGSFQLSRGRVMAICASRQEYVHMQGAKPRSTAGDEWLP